MKTMKIAVSRELLSTVSTHREKVTLDNTDFTDVAAVVMTTAESRSGILALLKRTGFQLPVFIFSQEHTDVPDGATAVISGKAQEFLELERRMIFKKNTAYDKIIKINAQGDTLYRAGKPNGWLIEQGGYPPLAFGFSQGYFYIKANSDRKWLTDKTDRCNANPDKAEIMHPVTSTFKTSTIAYKMPFENFPKDCWITFQVNIDWTEYGKEKETILKPGLLDVTMSYRQSEKEVKEHIVNNEEILIGRNDEEGYYFKFGIYRVGNSTIPVCYNLAGYKEQFRKVTTRITQF